MVETPAGQLVTRLLEPTPASAEQRRTVFQLQRDYDERFALTFDLTPRGLFDREAARQHLQEQVRTVLGDGMFGSWLAGEGGEFPQLVALATQHGLAPSVPLEVWRVKNEFTLRRLEIAAQPGNSPDQVRAVQAALGQQTLARLTAIVGPVALEAGRGNLFGWVPKR